MAFVNAFCTNCKKDKTASEGKIPSGLADVWLCNSCLEEMRELHKLID